MKNQVNHYLKSLLPNTTDWVQQIEKQAEIDSVPIMDELAINFLMQLVRIKQPKRILEIGTAIGYSSLRMHDAYPETMIYTIERDLEHVQQARANIEIQNKADHIYVLHGDALDQMVKLAKHKEQFDLIFIDAAKSKYKHFFKQATSLLQNQGLIVTDNVLFKGYVINREHAHSRYENIAEKIDSFNKWLAEQPEFSTTVIPIGDGVALSMKNKRERA